MNLLDAQADWKVIRPFQSLRCGLCRQPLDKDKNAQPFCCSSCKAWRCARCMDGPTCCSSARDSTLKIPITLILGYKAIVDAYNAQIGYDDARQSEFVAKLENEMALLCDYCGQNFKCLPGMSWRTNLQGMLKKLRD
ncbi:unnamed protein product, partial [Mesorhabditis spiculigera]